MDRWDENEGGDISLMRRYNLILYKNFYKIT